MRKHAKKKKPCFSSPSQIPDPHENSILSSGPPGPGPCAQDTTCPALKFKLPSRLRQKFGERRSAYQLQAAGPGRAEPSGGDAPPVAAPPRLVSALQRAGFPPGRSGLMTFPPKTRESQTSRQSSRARTHSHTEHTRVREHSGTPGPHARGGDAADEPANVWHQAAAECSTARDAP